MGPEISKNFFKILHLYIFESLNVAKCLLFLPIFGSWNLPIFGFTRLAALHYWWFNGLTLRTDVIISFTQLCMHWTTRVFVYDDWWVAGRWCVIVKHYVIYLDVICCGYCDSNHLTQSMKPMPVYLCCYLARTASTATCTASWHQEWISVGTRPSACKRGLFSSDFLPCCLLFLDYSKLRVYYTVNRKNCTLFVSSITLSNMNRF